MIERKWIKIAVIAVIVMILLLVFRRSRRREKLENGKCGETQEQIDEKCYEKCRAGFSPRGLNCYELCKEGETSEGLTCTNTKTKEPRLVLSYERGEIKPSSKEFNNFPPAECENGFQQFGTACMEKCKEGFVQTSFFCAESCPDAIQDRGLYCTTAEKSTLKKTYIPKFVFSKNADVANVMICMEGYARQTDSALCVQNCPAQHVIDGALCVEQCKADETDLNTRCLKGQTMRDKSIVPVNISEVPIKT